MIYRRFTNAAQLIDARSLVHVLELSYLQAVNRDAIYLVRSESNHVVALCDTVIALEKADLIIFYETADIDTTELTPSDIKQQIQTCRRELVFSAEKRLLKLNKYIEADKRLYADAEAEQIWQPYNNKPNYMLCITAINLLHKGQAIPLKHNYSSHFFSEDCVLDKDNKNQILQVFSLNDFAKIVATLMTPADLTDFLAFHQNYMITMQDYASELALLATYADSTYFLATALNIERRLVDLTLRTEVDQALSQPIVSNSNHYALLADMREANAFWHHLIQTFVAHVPTQLDSAKTTASYYQVACSLMFESLFSRYKIVKTIFEYHHASEIQKQEGYLVHQHSYTQFGRHYVLVFYGKNGGTSNHRSTMRARLKDLAQVVNARLQSPPMQEIIVIGIDLQDEGNIQTDLYYTTGQMITTNAAATKPQNVYDPVMLANSDKLHTYTQNSGHVDVARKINQDLLDNARIKKTFKHKSQINPTDQVAEDALCPCGSGKPFKYCHGLVKFN